MDEDAGFKVQGSGFRVQGSGFRVGGPGFKVQDFGFRVQNFGFRVQGLGHTMGYLSGICEYEEGSYLRLIDFVYYSTLGLRVIKKKGEVSVYDAAPAYSHLPLKHRIVRAALPAFYLRILKYTR